MAEEAIQAITGEKEDLVASRKGKNEWTIRATKDGASVNGRESGSPYHWTKEGLDAAMDGWNLAGIVTINHGFDAFGKILKASRDPEDPTFVSMHVKVDDYLDGWIDRNKEFIGVSIEASKPEFSNDRVTKAVGTGVTFIFPPRQPACSPDEGCKLMASKTDPPATDKQSVTAEHSAGESMTNETIEAAMKELAESKAKLEASDKALAELKAENEKLVAFKKDIVENERKALMAKLGELVEKEDLVAYENATPCELKRAINVIEAAKKHKEKIEAANPEFSGAKVTDDKLEASLAKEGYSKEDIAAYKVAQEMAEKVGLKFE